MKDGTLEKPSLEVIEILQEPVQVTSLLELSVPLLEHLCEKLQVHDSLGYNFTAWRLPAGDFTKNAWVGGI